MTTLSSIFSLINLAGSKPLLRLVSSQLLWRTVWVSSQLYVFKDGSPVFQPCSTELYSRMTQRLNTFCRWVLTLSFWVCMKWKRLTSTSLAISPSLWGSNHFFFFFLSKLKTDHVSPIYCHVTSLKFPSFRLLTHLVKEVFSFFEYTHYKMHLHKPNSNVIGSFEACGQLNGSESWKWSRTKFKNNDPLC